MCQPPGSGAEVDGLSNGLLDLHLHETIAGVLRERDPNSSTVNQSGYIWTTIPRSFLDARCNDPAGETECILRGGMKEAILAQPGFSCGVPAPLETAHTINPVPGRGLGMFATRELRYGDLIFAERPLIVAPAAYMTRAPPTETGEPSLEWLFMEWEDLLKAAVGRMSTENQEAYRALANSHVNDGSPPLLGIMRTNGFSASEALLQVFPGLSDGPEGRFSAVGKVLSRVNHSCAPNATVVMEPLSFTLQLIAVKPIALGDEITVTYCGLLDTQKQRQAQLDSYGFTCECPACSNAAESDERRTKIAEIRKSLGEHEFEMWIREPSLPEDYLMKHVGAMIDLIYEEGLQAATEYAYALELTAKSICAAGHIGNLIQATIAYKAALSTELGVTSPRIQDRLADFKSYLLKRTADSESHQEEE
ncbi:SET domain-containing protein [Obba rivulosa]|uniref:SET domain-containing protein n=1 Tax=Obba rivulosa TaxID=1052685 RepID=A0A8E2AR07_9APHY|nr:SET domain-containing protein [Obba rivulosa]